MTDVEDFRGGRIHYSGIKFGHQQQQIFWQAIEHYLRLKANEIFKRWDAETQSYSNEVRRGSVDGVERILRRFAAEIFQRATETDRALRGEGYPQNVQPFDASSIQTPATAKISRLAAAHRVLIDRAIENENKPAPPSRSYWKWFETFYADNKGVIWLCTAILVPVVVFVWHFLFI